MLILSESVADSNPAPRKTRRHLAPAGEGTSSRNTSLRIEAVHEFVRRCDHIAAATGQDPKAVREAELYAGRHPLFGKDVFRFLPEVTNSNLQQGC